MKLKSLRRSSHGSALVEFAITVPILLAVFFGIFEFARAWNVQQVITNAAREGARVAVVPNSTDAQINTAVQNRLTAAGVTGATISIFNTTVPGDPDSVVVSYDYQYQLFGKVVSLLSGGAVASNVNLSSTSIMRNE